MSGRKRRSYVIDPPVCQPRQQTGEMKDLAVGAAHGGEPVSVVQEPSETRIDARLVAPLMLDDGRGDEPVGFRDQLDAGQG